MHSESFFLHPDPLNLANGSGANLFGFFFASSSTSYLALSPFFHCLSLSNSWLVNVKYHPYVSGRAYKAGESTFKSPFSLPPAVTFPSATKLVSVQPRVLNCLNRTRETAERQSNVGYLAGTLADRLGRLTGRLLYPHSAAMLLNQSQTKQQLRTFQILVLRANLRAFQHFSQIGSKCTYIVPQPSQTTTNFRASKPVK